MSDMERLELYEKLEKAEGRIVALEKQVCCTVVVKTSLQGHSASKMSTSPSHSTSRMHTLWEQILRRQTSLIYFWTENIDNCLKSLLITEIVSVFLKET